MLHKNRSPCLPFGGLLYLAIVIGRMILSYLIWDCYILLYLMLPFLCPKWVKNFRCLQDLLNVPTTEGVERLPPRQQEVALRWSQSQTRARGFDCVKPSNCRYIHDISSINENVRLVINQVTHRVRFLWQFPVVRLADFGATEVLQWEASRLDLTNHPDLLQQILHDARCGYGKSMVNPAKSATNGKC